MSTAVQIPISAINILNPRSRNKAIFEAITRNIDELGLKIPIKVRRRTEPLDGKEYDLVHGEAAKSLRVSRPPRDPRVH